MCIAPLKILNRSSCQVPGLTPTYYNVPCGKCWQCQSARRDSYLVRCFYEYLKADVYNGWTLFLTLTYRDSTLPHVGHVPCFCKSDVQKYMKRFRTNLVRYYSKKFNLSIKDSQSLISDKLKYFVSSENGDKRHRPHYHILLFCSSPQLSPWVARKLACDSWKLGYAVPSEQNYGFVNSVDGIKYVTKYVGKSLVDEQYYNKLLDQYKDSEFFDKLVENKPFLLSSKGLGLFAVDKQCPDSYKLTFDLFSQNKCIIEDSKKVQVSKPVPQYYKRKFCFDVQVEKIEDKYHVQYKLNDFGLELKSKSYDSRLETFNKNLQIALGSKIPYPELFDKTLVDSFGKGTDTSYCRDFLLRMSKDTKFAEYCLLYSQYSKFYDVDELNGVYHHIDPSSLDFFRNHVSYFDPAIAVSYDNIDLYHEFWLQILNNIFYFEKNYPEFKSAFSILNMLLFHINKYKTLNQYNKDRVLSDFRKLKD